jgi:anti-anti-sigma factor
MAVSSLEVSIATGASGPVLALAGEADFTSVTRLDEALAAQTSGQAVQLTIDAANLRYADSASMRTLVMAAMKVRARAGSVMLLDPQPSVARIRRTGRVSRRRWPASLKRSGVQRSEVSGAGFG